MPRTRFFSPPPSLQYPLGIVCACFFDQATASFDAAQSNFKTPAERFCYWCWCCSDPDKFPASDVAMLDFSLPDLSEEEVRFRIEFGIELYKASRLLYVADAAVVKAGEKPQIFVPDPVNTVLNADQRKTYDPFVNTLKAHSELWDTVKRVAP